MGGGPPTAPIPLALQVPDPLDCIIQTDLIPLLELQSLGHLLQGHNSSAGHRMEVFRWTPKKQAPHSQPAQGCALLVGRRREIPMLLPWQRVSPNLVGVPGKGEVSGMAPATGTAQEDGQQEPQGQFQPGISFPGRGV